MATDISQSKSDRETGRNKLIDLKITNIISLMDRIIALTIAFLVLPFEGAYAGTAQVDDPADKLAVYTRYASSQKLHLHFNKNNFMAGETMWFSAYLVNAVSHLPEEDNTNVYVDLIDSDGVLMERRVLLAENGFAEGDISLPTALPDGNYVLRAYTDWMKNFGEDFYFSRYFYISNRGYENMIPRSDARSNRRFNRRLSQLESDHEIAFFPEGGHLAAGVSNRVAFKAVNALGGGVDARGIILDNAGNEVASFSALHAGMGVFELEPELGRSYRARVEFGNGGRDQEFDLPEVRHDAVALRVYTGDEDIIISLGKGDASGGAGYDDYHVVAHSRGRVIHSAPLRVEDGAASMTLSLDKFPAGITHITIFNNDSRPVAERLSFISRDESLMIYPRVFKVEHEQQEYLALRVEVTDDEGREVEGHFSMSVLAGGFDPPASTSNILSNFLLTSDLQGIIENPQDYFDPDQGLDKELDLLMMTHGWRRFNWQEVIAGVMPELTHDPSSSLTITGRITDPAKNEPVNNHFVELKVLSGHDNTYSTRTDGRGRFVFDGLEYPDLFQVEIGSPRLAGDYPPEIELERAQVRGHDFTPNIYTAEKQITSRGRNWSRVADAGRSPYAERAERTRTPQRYGIPDQTIYIDRETVTQRTVLDVLIERAQGLQFFQGQLMFRGPTSINLSSEPMFMLDGVQTGRDVVLSQSPREIERIEIFRGSSAATFGVRGGAGVIIAYTRQAGDRGFQDTRQYTINGYHSPREFYSDFITASTGAPADEETARTIHWDPDVLGGEDDEDNTIFLPWSDNLGQMKIIIEGMGRYGGLGSGEFTIEIR